MNVNNWFTSEYVEWKTKNNEALKTMGPIATSNAYTTCYGYLKALLPCDYNYEKGDWK